MLSPPIVDSTDEFLIKDPNTPVEINGFPLGGTDVGLVQRKSDKGKEKVEDEMEEEAQVSAPVDSVSEVVAKVVQLATPIWKKRRKRGGRKHRGKKKKKD
jgi:uncharacterized protein (UPF0548 family)